MPYCEQHDEVYRGEECPVCAGEDGSEADDGTGVRGAGEGEGDDVARGLDGVVDAVDDAVRGGEGGPGPGIDAGDIADAIDGDVVTGDQEKTVEHTDVTEVDESTVEVDDSTEVHDHSTTVEDSVLNRSDVGDAGGATEVDDSVVQGSDVGGEGGDTSVEDSVVKGSDVGGGGGSTEVDDSVVHDSTVGGEGEGTTEGKQESGEEETRFCMHCGEEIAVGVSFCPACGGEQPE